MLLLLLQAQQATNSALHLPLLLQQLGIDLIAVLILSVIYYRKHKNTDYVFTFFMFNVLIFFICYYMVNIELGVGFGFGLFALFSILRYRTATVFIKEMTYLFAVIAIAVINSLSIHTADWTLTAVANASILGAAILLDVVWLRYPLHVQRVIYEKIDLIKPENRPQLLADLRERLGVEVVQIAIENINFLNDTATIFVFFRNRDSMMVQMRRDD
ncbi:DUF4956 domain-containing protein [Sphingobacteriales bacterium UPWRP_1]|nr:hypothetical protein BVG80_05105 [Sphingobacteriales bacterium TSM_CSM]PSJ76250.1 DUF4956 domain-containing protein [Sphingobacteriales bacterium UPWRP_1]